MLSSISDVPGVPKNLDVVTVDKDSVTLSWEPPTTDGGSPLTGYVIEKRDSARPGATWMGAGIANPDKTEFTVTRLFEGAEYVFRVGAENVVGTSDYVDLGRPVTAKLPFCEFAMKEVHLLHQFYFERIKTTCSLSGHINLMIMTSLRQNDIAKPLLAQQRLCYCIMHLIRINEIFMAGHILAKRSRDM